VFFKQAQIDNPVLLPLARPCWSQVFATKRRRWHLGDQLIANCGHHLTDVGSWPRLRSAGQAALAAMAAMSSQRMFTGIVSRCAPIAVQVSLAGHVINMSCHVSYAHSQWAGKPAVRLGSAFKRTRYPARLTHNEVRPCLK